MTTLTKLSATAVEAPWQEPYNIVSSVHVEPAPGQFGVLQLGAAGLTLRLGKAVAGIPLADLLAIMVPAAAAVGPAAKSVPANAKSKK